MIQHSSASFSVGEFLRARRTEIVSLWRKTVRALAPAPGPPRLRDDIPDVLDRIADSLARSEPEQGSETEQVAREYSVLRSCIVDLWLRDRHASARPGELALLNEAIDHAVIVGPLRVTEERLALAIESAQLGTWEWDTRTGHVLWSDRLRVIFGLAESDPISFDLVVAAVHPEDRANMLAQLRKAEDPSGSGAYDNEYRFIRKDGQVRWLQSRGRVFFETIQGKRQAVRGAGIAIDVTDRRARDDERQRRVKHALLRADVVAAFNEKAPVETVLRACVDAIVRHLGAAFARAWLLDEKQHVLILRASAGLYTHTDGRHARIAVGALKIGRIAEERLPHLSNSVLEDDWVSDKAWARREGMVAFAGYPLVIHDRLLGVLALFSRTTLEPDTFDALGSVANLIAQGLERRRVEEELDRAVRARDEFVAVLSHDLRTPIGAIALGASLLHRSVETIRTAANRAGHMIDDLLQEIELEGGRVQFSMLACTPATLITEVFELYQPSVQERRITLIKDVAEDLPAVLCDRDYILRAFQNIVGNAKKFTPAGGTIALGAEAVEGAVKFSVSDTGPGVALEEQARIFDRGFRGTERPEAGLGLGLAIAKGIVEAHDGRIGVVSEPGHGATFWFTLPMA